MSLDATRRLDRHLAAPKPFDPEADDRLVCTAVLAETHDVATFVFEPAEPALFAYRPGQFLTFSFPLPDGPVNRCYTIASSPLRPHAISITVKRVPGGPVSNWLHEHCRPGTVVTALGPMGDFTCLADPAERYLFLSGGSGITPLMSMTRAFADLARPVDVVFLHAARTPGDVVFRAELDLIARRLPGFRLVLLPERTGDEPGWPGPLGRLSADLLRLLVPDVLSRSVWCCGPDPFMGAVRAILAGLGHDPRFYHQESFDFSTLAAEEPAVAAEAADGPAPPPAATHTVHFQKLDRTVTVAADQFVLAAARDQGVRLPSSCTSGLCGTCKTKLVSGTVDMRHQGGIRQREIDAGFFLPCCSKPLSDLVVDR